jgi:hypothetical protein
MATTWIKPIHKVKGRSVAATLAERIGYADNPDKTNSYEFVKSFGCDYYTAANEFALSKELYEQHTGRSGRIGDILAYHVRQSFKPGEITPEKALEVGYALMEKFTHGRHQFVVAVHTDKQHIHCHCIFNAVNMDCSGKFRNPLGSMKIVRQISDFLCAERGLSIVENPAKSQGSYRDWQDKKEPQTNKDKLLEMIDNHISAGMMFEQFIAAMHSAGCDVKRGKYLAFKIPGAERFIRVKSIGEDYTEQALRERCIGKRIVATKMKIAESSPAMRVPKLLIDIQAKLQQAHSPGFEHYAIIYNLKEMARTLIFLKERGIGTYDELAEKTRTVTSEYNGNQDRINEITSRQKEIAELQKKIGTYGKTKEKYSHYKKLQKYQQTSWEKFRKTEHPSVTYYEAERTDIALHEAAKKYFDEHGFKGNKKLPSINSLKEEYAKLDAEKRKLYSGHKTAREDMIALKTAKQNVDMFFGEPRQPQQLERKKTYDHSR